MRIPFLLIPILCTSNPCAAAVPDRAELTQKVAAGGEATWRKAPASAPDLSARELFACTLASCETGQHADRMERLFETAARMQDTDPSSKGYGNFRWSWKHVVVLDFSAVDFSMHSGALI